MKKAWSLSTTVRNPERILPFLRVLKEMEGEKFDEKGQIKFQTLLIQNRLYQPTKMSEKLLGYYDTAGDKMELKEANEIFQHMLDNSSELQKDNGLRGRTSVAPLTKMGLAIAKKSSGEVTITDLGNAFLKGDLDIGDVYFRFFIKWQIPNPDSKDYSQDGTYNIKPFVGVLHLINKVNKKEIERGNKDKGISKEEFSIFAPSLIHYKNIDKYSEEIIKLRDLIEGKNKQEKKKIIDDYKKTFAEKFLETKDKDEIQKLLKNLKDYGDNAIRYFRLTRYFHIRGNGFYVDLEPRRIVEIENILKYDNSEALSFSSKEDYLNYIVDISQPKLPWETKNEFIKIIKNLFNDIHIYEEALGIKPKETVSYKELAEEELKKYVNDLRKYRRELQEKENHQKSQNIDNVKEYINTLKNIYNLDNKPVVLEKYISLGLNALNDALEIRPNYPVGDDNEPTFTAPANTPDIECYYKSFNTICEVTMLNGRDQWYNEGQPVMRHLRDFENRNNDKKAYCLFVAPKLHRDTINTFWLAVKYEYEGKKQKIIPISINQFIELLKTLVELKERNVFLEHKRISDLYEEIIKSSNEFGNSNDWLQNISNLIDSWRLKILS